MTITTSLAGLMAAIHMTAGIAAIPDPSGTSESIPAFLFFFSSRRRHTRLVSDWSSDVCSSDLGASLVSPGTMEAYEHKLPKDAPLRPLFLVERDAGAKPDWTFNMLLKHGVREIGRASCRERV